MTNERWMVTHTTESGATRMWWVDRAAAMRVLGAVGDADWSAASSSMLNITTLTGRALIWLTPGQSLTVEKSNG